MKYDYLIVGAGLYGSVFAYEARRREKRCLVIDKRRHIGGNCFTKAINGINVHSYGAHIFHTSNKEVWDFMRKFCEFNNFINTPIANYKGELYNLPFNMNTFCKMWDDIRTPYDARRKIEKQRGEFNSIVNPQSLAEQGLRLVGKDIYSKLIKGYSEKQWGMDADEIPAEVLSRVPIRYTFNNNYFDDTYQGIPIGGYTQIFLKLLDGIDILLNTDFLEHRAELAELADRILYTGPIDAYFDYVFGALDYRSLRFKHELLLGVRDYQGNAVFNFTDRETPYTRIIEHKHFEFGTQEDTVITYEYPIPYAKDEEPYYPICNEKNFKLYVEYNKLAESHDNVSFCGRLGEYMYYDMDDTVFRALNHPWLLND